MDEPAADVSQTPAVNPLDTPSNDALVLTDTETLILDLYAKERELELERSLLEARQAGPYCFQIKKFIKEPR